MIYFPASWSWGSVPIHQLIDFVLCVLFKLPSILFFKKSKIDEMNLTATTWENHLPRIHTGVNSVRFLPFSSDLLKEEYLQIYCFLND